MKSSTKSDTETEDLICPITLQIFRDPVVAADGRTYERAAIVQWIAEHGTSPFIRQPLNVNELQADDYLKNLAAQRRNSTISHTYNINVDQPVSIQLQTMLNSNVASTSNIENRHVSHTHHSDEHRCLFSIIFMAALGVVVFLVYRLNSYTRDRDYYGEFSMNT